MEVIWNLIFLQKQAKNTCFNGKKNGKKLWNWQKVWNEFHKKVKLEKKNETPWKTVKSFMKENYRCKIINIGHDFDVKEPKIFD